MDDQNNVVNNAASAANTTSTKNWQEKLDKALHEKNAFTDLLEKAEKKTGVSRLYLVYGSGIFIFLYLCIGYGAHVLCNLVGFLYPAYASLKAIESTDKDDDTRWLTYWVVYAAFMLVETFTDIFFSWIPLYSLLKCGFFIYCMVPTKWNGAETIYYKVLRPFVLKHEKKIDETLNQVTKVASGVMNEVEKAAGEAGQRTVSRTITSEVSYRSSRSTSDNPASDY